MCLYIWIYWNIYIRVCKHEFICLVYICIIYCLHSFGRAAAKHTAPKRPRVIRVVPNEEGGNWGSRARGDSGASAPPLHAAARHLKFRTLGGVRQRPSTAARPAPPISYPLVWTAPGWPLWRVAIIVFLVGLRRNPTAIRIATRMDCQGSSRVGRLFAVSGAHAWSNEVLDQAQLGFWCSLARLKDLHGQPFTSTRSPKATVFGWVLDWVRSWKMAGFWEI